jgi:hypothetical protein
MNVEREKYYPLYGVILKHKKLHFILTSSNLE